MGGILSVYGWDGCNLIYMYDSDSVAVCNEVRCYCGAAAGS